MAGITGTGTLTINVTAGFISTSEDNSGFTGDIDIVAGGLQLRKAAGLGTTAGKTTVRSNAVLTLDQNGTGGGGQVPNDNNYKDALVLENNATLRNKAAWAAAPPTASIPATSPSNPVRRCWTWWARSSPFKV